MRHEFFNERPVAIDPGLPAKSNTRPSSPRFWCSDSGKSGSPPRHHPHVDWRSADQALQPGQHRGGPRRSPGPLARRFPQYALSRRCADLDHGWSAAIPRDLPSRGQSPGTEGKSGAGQLGPAQVEDTAQQDGGSPQSLGARVDTNVAPTSPVTVDVRFLGGLSPTQQAAFAHAAQRWAHIITGDLPPATVEGVLIDDVLIEAEGVLIDGPGRILGQAGSERPFGRAPTCRSRGSCPSIRNYPEPLTSNCLLHKGIEPF